MIFDEIIESGFVKAFIESYFDTYEHDAKAEDKLNFSLCNNDEEKQDYILKKSKQLKTEIKELGYHELSFGVIQSMNPQLEFHYVDREKNPDFWIERFCREIETYFESFTPIYDAVLLFNDKKSIDEDCLNSENAFWQFYPGSLHPKSKNLMQIIEAEFGLLDYIKEEIENFEETEFWEIDIEDYRRFMEVSNPMKIIQEHSELFARLSRLFQLSTLTKNDQTQPQKIESNPDSPHEQSSHQPKTSAIQEDSRTLDLIKEKIDGIDRDKGWEYAFRSREDLDVFVELLTCFFEQREYELPDEVIRLRKGSKTRMATIIKQIHQELSDRPLNGDNEFLNIVRKLYPFIKDSNLYKTISR